MEPLADVLDDGPGVRGPVVPLAVLLRGPAPEGRTEPVAGSPAENSSHVVTATGTDATAVLDGFSIKAGRAGGSQTAGGSDPDFPVSGAGAWIGNGSPSFVGCTFLTNVAIGKGGAVLVKGGNPTFTGCKFTDNTSIQHGGAVYISGGAPRFADCSFTSNAATSNAADGGALYATGPMAGTLTLERCSFTDNEAGAGGGVALNAVLGATLVDCTFDNNRCIGGGSVRHGAGLDMSGSTATVIRCEFNDNDTGVDGGGQPVGSGGAVFVHGTNQAAFEDTVFRRNTAAQGGAMRVSSTGASATISGSTFEANSATEGGGLDSDSQESSVTVIGSVFRGNHATSNGGAIRTLAGSLALYESVFGGPNAGDSNYAVNGGAVYVDKDADVTIDGCIVEGNGVMPAPPDPPVVVAVSGGGLHVYSPTGSFLTRSIVRKNSALSWGGGVYVFVDQGTAVIENCLIAGNVTNLMSGGVHVSGEYATVSLVNTTVADNHATVRGGGLYSDVSPGWLYVDNSILWGNTFDEEQVEGAGPQISLNTNSRFRFNDVQGGLGEIQGHPAFVLDWQPSNLDSDPRFVDPVNGDYRLSPGPPQVSPCIDSGSNNLIIGNIDADRGPRIVNCVVDRGAYEHTDNFIEGPSPAPDGLVKNRYISFKPGNPGKNTAIRVKLVSMYDPTPPPAGAPDLSRFKNQWRWVVAPPLNYFDRLDPNGQGAAALLKCQPDYYDWTLIGEQVLKKCSAASQPSFVGGPCSEDKHCHPLEASSGPGTCVPMGSSDPLLDVLHVIDTEIIPDSAFVVQMFDPANEACEDLLEGMFSAPLTLTTARWGDIALPFKTPANSQPDTLDITQAINHFKGLIGAPRRVVAQLYLSPTSPTGATSALDITAVVDAFKGLPYAPSGLVFCPCSDEADIRADLDGDGDIDADDDALEATEVLYFVVNSDDDNGNDIEDYLDDGPVFAEDDLAELGLGAKCPALDPDTAWWSISWTEPDPGNPSLKVWSTPDKSDGQGGAGTPIGNGVQNDWPPPETLWLESVTTFNSLDVTFSIVDNSVAPSAGRVSGGGCSSCRQNTIATAAPCTPGKYWARAYKSRTQAGITGGTGMIQTCNTTLCGAPNASLYASSNAWVSIARENRTKWAQVGYANDRLPGTTAASFKVYIETNVGPTRYPYDYDIAFFDAPDPGLHEYRLDLVGVLGAWWFYYDGIQLDVSNSPTWSGWVGLTGDEIHWAAEIHNLEDQMVGTPTAKCRFAYCQWQLNEGAYYELVELNQYNLRIDPQGTPIGLWDIALVDPQGQFPNWTSWHIDIWDKVP